MAQGDTHALAIRGGVGGCGLRAKLAYQREMQAFAGQVAFISSTAFAHHSSKGGSGSTDRRNTLIGAVSIGRWAHVAATQPTHQPGSPAAVSSADVQVTMLERRANVLLGDMIPRDDSEAIEVSLEYTMHPSDDVTRETVKVRRNYEGVITAKLCTGDDHHLRHSLHIEIVAWVDDDPQLAFRRESL
jgi:hypothetical protein